MPKYESNTLGWFTILLPTPFTKLLSFFDIFKSIVTLFQSNNLHLRPQANLNLFIFYLVSPTPHLGITLTCLSNATKSITITFNISQSNELIFVSNEVSFISKFKNKKGHFKLFLNFLKQLKTLSFPLFCKKSKVTQTKLN